MSDDTLPMTQHGIDHAEPLSRDARVRRSRLAEVLAVPTLYDDHGRLSRVVGVYKGSIGKLIELLATKGFRLETANHPGHDGVPEVEGCSLLDVGRGVLVGHWDDIDETLTVPGRLDAVLGDGAREELLTNRHLLRPPAEETGVYHKIRTAAARARVLAAEEKARGDGAYAAMMTDPVVQAGAAAAERLVGEVIETEQDKIQREIDEAARSGKVQRPRYVFWVFQAFARVKTETRGFLTMEGRWSFDAVGAEEGWELSAPWPWSLVPDEGLGVCLYSPDGQFRLTAKDALATARAERYGFRVERELPK